MSDEQAHNPPFYPQLNNRSDWVRALNSYVPFLYDHLRRSLRSSLDRPDESPIVETLSSILDTNPTDITDTSERETLLNAQHNLLQRLQDYKHILAPLVESSSLIRKAFVRVIDQNVTDLLENEQNKYEDSRVEALNILKNIINTPTFSPVILDPDGGTELLEAVARHTSKKISSTGSTAVRSRYIASEILARATFDPFEEKYAYPIQVAEALSQEGIMEKNASSIIEKPPEAIDCLPYPSNSRCEGTRWNLLFVLQKLSKNYTTASIVVDILVRPGVMKSIFDFLGSLNPDIPNPDKEVRTLREQAKQHALVTLGNLLDDEELRVLLLKIIHGDQIGIINTLSERKQEPNDLFTDRGYSEAYEAVNKQALFLLTEIQNNSN